MAADRVPRQVERADLRPDTGGVAEPVLDDRARAADRARLAELRGERDEARDWHDPERSARLGAEIDAPRPRARRGAGPRRPAPPA